MKLFNSFLKDDLPLSFEYIRVVQHYSRFSTVSGLLAPNISKEFNSQGDPDTLHLNAAGLRLFGSVIKNAIFYRKNFIQKEVLVEVAGCNRMVGAIAVP